MKAKCMIIILLFGVSLLLAFEDANSRVGLGLHFGTQTGNGYAMRWMGRLHGAQGTLGAYTIGSNNVKFEDSFWDYDESAATITRNKNGREAAVNLAANYLFMLDHFKTGRLYLIGGGSYTYYQKRVYSKQYRQQTPGSAYYEAIDGTESDYLKREDRWTVGFGPGFEIILGKQFRFSIEVPITYNYKDEIVMYIPQAGIYYYFK